LLCRALFVFVGSFGGFKGLKNSVFWNQLGLKRASISIDLDLLLWLFVVVSLVGVVAGSL